MALLYILPFPSWRVNRVFALRPSSTYYTTQENLNWIIPSWRSSVHDSLWRNYKTNYFVALRRNRCNLSLPCCCVSLPTPPNHSNRRSDSSLSIVIVNHESSPSSPSLIFFKSPCTLITATTLIRFKFKCSTNYSSWLVFCRFALIQLNSAHPTSTYTDQSIHSFIYPPVAFQFQLKNRQ